MSIRIAATGDSFIVQPIPSTQPGFSEVAQLLSQCDVRFTNLETVIRRNEGFPAAQSGGTWASSPPEVLESLREYGFNCMAWANNHTLDYSYGGLEATARYLDQGGWVHAGAGRNLPEASAARFLETPHGKVALIAATASYHESWTAGLPRGGDAGRPGINPLGHTVRHQVAAERLTQLQAIAEECGINAKDDLRIKEGFQTPDPAGVTRFGKHRFLEAKPDTGSGESTAVSKRDAERILREIAAAATAADLVLVSLHVHDGRQASKTDPPDFMVEFAHACIEGGAGAVIGHGPHVLRGVEIHRGRPIFYSLGNFIFQNELVQHLPSDFYQKYGIDLEMSTREALNVRSQGGSRGLMVNRSVWHSVIALWEMQDGALSGLELQPVDLGWGKGVEERGAPVLTSQTDALEEIIELSRPFGTTFKVKNGRASI